MADSGGAAPALAEAGGPVPVGLEPAAGGGRRLWSRLHTHPSAIVGIGILAVYVAAVVVPRGSNRWSLVSRRAALTSTTNGLSCCGAGG